MSLRGPKDDNDVREGIFVTKIQDGSPANGVVPLRSRIYAIDGTSPLPLIILDFATMFSLYCTR